MILQKYKKILIIRLSSLGDILLTTPIIRRIKNSSPDSCLYFLTDIRFTDILKNNPYITKIIEYNKKATKEELNAFKKLLKNEFEFDLIIDLHNNLRSNAISRLFDCKKIKANKRRLFKLSSVYLKYKDINPKSVVDVYQEQLMDLGLKSDDKGLDFFLKAKNIDSSVIINPKIRIGIAPSASFSTKMWKIDNFANLAKKLRSELDCEIVLFGDKNDKYLSDEFRQIYGDDFRDFVAKTTILELASEIKTCDLLVCNDSANMHIAAALDVPIVALFGSTTPELGFFPYKAKNKIIEIELGCRPCTHIGRKECPKGHFECMNGIKIDMVFEAVKELLNAEAKYEQS